MQTQYERPIMDNERIVISGESFGNTLQVPRASIYKEPAIVFTEPTAKIRESEISRLFDAANPNKLSWLFLGIFLKYCFDMFSLYVAHDDLSARHWQIFSLALLVVVGTFTCERRISRLLEKWLKTEKYRLKQDIQARLSGKGEFAAIRRHDLEE
jgi:hypothetical protein